MKIYTKTGDGGDTGLFGGARVPKDSVRVAAYGDVDELNAAIGVVRALDPAAFADELLQTVQRALFTMGAELATPDPAARAKVLARSGAPLAARDVGVLEDAIDTLTAQLAPLTEFILPGGTPRRQRCTERARYAAGPSARSSRCPTTPRSGPRSCST
jgi:cob(I)alamin adenosyltransferase